MLWFAILWQHMGLIYCKMHVIDRPNWGLLGDYLKKVQGFFFKTQLEITSGLLGELFIHYPEVHLMGQTHLDAHYQSWQQIILFGRFDLSEAQPCTEWRWSSMKKHQQHARSCLWLNIEDWPLAENRVIDCSADFLWTPMSPLSTSARGVATCGQCPSNSPTQNYDSSHIYIWLE